MLERNTPTLTQSPSSEKNKTTKNCVIYHCPRMSRCSNHIIWYRFECIELHSASMRSNRSMFSQGIFSVTHFLALYRTDNCKVFFFQRWFILRPLASRTTLIVGIARTHSARASMFVCAWLWMMMTTRIRRCVWLQLSSCTTATATAATKRNFNLFSFASSYCITYWIH